MYLKKLKNDIGRVVCCTEDEEILEEVIKNGGKVF